MSFAGRWLAVSCLALLAACGGGGGGSGGGNGGGGVTGGKLSLSPTRLTGTVSQYVGGTLTISGALSPVPPNADTLYIAVVDGGETFYQGADIAGSPASFTATVHTLPWLSPGTYTGSVRVRACQDFACAAPIAGYDATLTYSVLVQPPVGETHRLNPSAVGVAFASTPTASILSRKIWVSDNFAAKATWSATSDSPWLTVTPTGTSDATVLTISADPTSLPAGEASVATVTLTAPGLVGATIRVGLWKDANAAPAQAVVSAVNATGLARDPVLPYVYVVDGTNRIQVYNAHTASLVRTIPDVGTNLGGVAISPDGTRAYALDTYAVQVVDLATRRVVETWQLRGQSFFAESMQVVRPNGDDVVLLGDGTALAHAGVVGNTDIAGTIAATDDGGVVYSAHVGSTIDGWLTGYSNANAQFYAAKAVTASGIGGVSSRIVQIAVAGDGSGLYVADYSGGCMQVDPVALEMTVRFPWSGHSVMAGVAMAGGGNVACGYGYFPGDSADDIGVFSPGGAAVGAFSTYSGNFGVVERLLVTSGDGLVSVGGVKSVADYLDGNDILFIPMGTPSTAGAQGQSLPVRGHADLRRQAASAPALRR